MPGMHIQQALKEKKWGKAADHLPHPCFLWRGNHCASGDRHHTIHLDAADGGSLRRKHHYTDIPCMDIMGCVSM